MPTRILSHNVYWFQGHPFKGDQPPAPNPAVLQALSGLYQSLAPTLICLQEIQSPQTATLLSDQLRMPIFYTPGRQLTPYGAAASSLNATFITDSSAAAFAPQRVWQLLTLPFGTSHLTLANIHLPSARQLPGPQAAQQRILELQSILTLHPETDILLGDFNESPLGSVSNFLTAQGYLNTANLLQDSALATPVTSVKNGRGDQIWIKKSLAPKLTAFAVVAEPQMRTTLHGITHLSDHFPLYIDLEANP